MTHQRSPNQARRRREAQSKTETMTVAQYKARKKPSKYRNIPVKANGEHFASKREYRRHLVLLDRQAQGEITDLRRQPRFHLHIKGRLITTYIGDWAYTEKRRQVVEDSKGYQTKDFIIKWALCQVLFPNIEWRLS